MVADQLKDRLRMSEGLRLKPYHDTRGILTIGYGLNLEEGITKAEAEWLLDSRVNAAVADAKAFFPAIDTLSQNRQVVLTEMAYNLGLPRLKLFTKFRTALGKGDFAKAAAEMEASAWASQVKNRAYDLAAMMRKG